MGLTGPDVSEPEEHLAPMIEQFNREGKAPFAMRMAVPADYEAAVPARADWPVFKGELNPIFQGTYSSRIELKSWMRIDEQKILTAEKLGALAACMGFARRSGCDLECVGAGALQRDARPGVGRHDRSRLRRHRPKLRVLTASGRTRSLTPNGMSSPRRSTPEGREHRSSCSTPWDGRDPTLSRLMRDSAKGASSNRS